MGRALHRQAWSHPGWSMLAVSELLLRLRMLADLKYDGHLQLWACVNTLWPPDAQRIGSPEIEKMFAASVA